MKEKKRIQFWTFSLSLLFIFLYIPFALIVYTPYFYESQYERLEIYDNIEQEKAINATKNLRGYFLYSNSLDSTYWNEKEQLHMSDVRNIYSVLLFLFILSLSLLKLTWDKKYLIKASAVNMVILGILLLLIIPLFSFFWNNIFHPLLFSNDYWMYTPEDISYYLFPERFFVHATVFIFIVATVIQTTLFYIRKKLEMSNNSSS